MLMVPPASPTGILRYQLIDRLANVHELSRDYSPNLFIPKGSVGFGAPTFEISDAKLPKSPGKSVRQINTQERILDIPHVIIEDNLGDLANAANDLFSWYFSGDEESRSPVTFRVTRPDNSVRQVEGYYLSGLEGDTDDGGPDWTQYNVKLYVPNPYPTAPSYEIVAKRSVAQSDPFGIMNPGDMPAYPIWIFYGPLINIAMFNETTNTSFFTSSLTLTTGQYAVFDFRPSDIRPGLSVYRNDGLSLLNTVVPASTFGTLASGLNTVHVTYGASTDGNSGVSLSYLPRYRSLLR
jgi:hypothetical protein